MATCEEYLRGAKVIKLAKKLNLELTTDNDRWILEGDETLLRTRNTVEIQRYLMAYQMWLPQRVKRLGLRLTDSNYCWTIRKGDEIIHQRRLPEFAMRFLDEYESKSE